MSALRGNMSAVRSIFMNRIVEKVNFPVPKQPKAKRVAAYARVSSGKDAMLHSLSAQVSYYSELIQNHPGWLYCGIFTDEAYTGTKDNRKGFQKLISDCRKGNIDLIITKSISRFARNTVTLLETVRKLKLLGIDVFFEEQNIHTISADGELMMTILASYAQEESLSASENQKWRIRKSFEKGEIMNLRFLFGYQINGRKIEIDRTQAEIVREVFKRAVDGESFTSIASDLNNRNITRCLGGRWNHQRIKDLLSNEKYLGNALLQKKYRNNHLEKKLVKNEGELAQYYAEGTHDAIIDEETFAKAQEIIRNIEKKREGCKKPELCAFSGMIICSDCGAKYKRTTNKGKHSWQCTTFLTKGKIFCPSKQIPEEEVYRTATEALKLDEFDSLIFQDKIKNIIAEDNYILTFCFKDGTEISEKWIPRSRKNSWTDEMRECARQRVLKQRGRT